MVNIIWLLLLLAGFAAAAWQGNIGMVTQAAFAGAAKSVDLIVSLAGVLMLWLGVLAFTEAGRIAFAIAAPFVSGTSGR